MKKFNLKIGGIKEMLSKEQMKKISGGYCGGSDASCRHCEDFHLSLFICFDDPDCGSGGQLVCGNGASGTCIDAGCP